MMKPTETETERRRGRTEVRDEEGNLVKLLGGSNGVSHKQERAKLFRSHPRDTRDSWLARSPSSQISARLSVGPQSLAMQMIHPQSAYFA